MSEQTELEIYKEVESLSSIEYDKKRKEIAKKHSIRVITLDDIREKYSIVDVPGTESDQEMFSELEPWPSDVNGKALLDSIRKDLNSYCSLPEHCDVAVTLWVIACYLINNFRIFPKLAANSPQKRCGKTTFLEFLASVCPKALMTSNLSGPVIFRIIDKHQPTLIIDELDTFMDKNDELRGIINSGHTRSGAHVIRCVGEDNEPQKFSTWSAMALARIGEWASTIADRSIGVRLERKPANVQLKRLPIDLELKHKHHRRQCMKWASENQVLVASCDPQVPSVDNNRAEDNWRPLLAVAETIGGDWPTLAREAMKALESQQDTEDEVLSLLRDIQDICAERKDWHKAVPSKLLTEQLNTKDDSPWPSMRGDRGITSNQVGKMLRPFGLVPGTVKDGAGNKSVIRGYYRERLEKVFLQYIPRKSVTPLPVNERVGFSENENVTNKRVTIPVTPLNNEIPNRNATGNEVTGFQGGARKESISSTKNDQFKEVI